MANVIESCQLFDL